MFDIATGTMLVRSRVSQARLALEKPVYSTWTTMAEFLGEAGGKAGAFGQPFLDDIVVQTNLNGL